MELTKLEQELRPLVAIQAEHAKANQEAQREAALKALATAAQADQRMLEEPVARAYGDGARAAAAEVRQEQRDEKFSVDQAAWRESVAARNPDRARPVEQVLTVVDGRPARYQPVNLSAGRRRFGVAGFAPPKGFQS